MSTALHMPGFISPPSRDPKPVELAAVSEIMDDCEPETYLGLVFYRPDGGCRLWHAWTDGGDVLGDQIDGLALAAGLDAGDWLHIGDRHSTVRDRGRIRIQVHPLRPILADVQAGQRCTEERRAGLYRLLDCAAERTGQTPPAVLPRWIGFGPALLNRKAPR
ncbi:hypothetical protein DI272_19145 [Streptomyces sp. Act143]|uniref:hypothetical protein n=1 Tax=Streptomyces sp. Act143 TaxID=2200760 RepID=UPI000D67D8DF|nr:hypothetical protein [Streptomyces sp. Act143]PWI16048.1 hypothetical protein DI272_19145 [Streptomyces sp. Act143]